LIARAALLGACALLLGSAGAEAQRMRMREGGPNMANPSAVVAAELGFARLAQTEGQWTAFRETADKDAVMFVPDAVNAQAWLRKRADPAQPVKWQPYRVFVSCDGSHALSTGPWTGPDGTSGTFSTIWRRQKDGGWKWIVDFGSATKIPAQQDVSIEGRIAQCSRPDERRERGKPPERKVVAIPNPPPASGEGQSGDGSLRWRWAKGDTETLFTVTMRTATGEEEVLHETAPAPGAS
jgi:hypothetical protein